MSPPRPETVAAALDTASRLLDACDRLGELVEADNLTEECARQRAWIRQQFAYLTAGVRDWEPGQATASPPGSQPERGR